MARKQTGDRKSWKGGYARWNGKSWVYYLSIHRQGFRIEKSTGVRDDEGLAEKHLDWWENHKNSYDPRDVGTDRSKLLLDDALIDNFCDYQGAPRKEGGKANSREHVERYRSALRWWKDQLKGRNLRTVTVDLLTDLCPLRTKKPLAQKTFKRIAAKALINWLRRSGSKGLSLTEGPDVGKAFEVPQRSRGANYHDMPPEEYAQRARKGSDALIAYYLVREVIAPHWRDCLDLLAATGWHCTEIGRWAKHGYMVEKMPPGREGEGAGVMVTVHKSGKEHRTIVSAEGLAAAARFAEWNKSRLGMPVQSSEKNADGKWVGRMRKRGVFPVRHFQRVVRNAVKRINREFAAGKRKERCPESFGPGHARHMIGTYGAATSAPSDIGLFLGHAAGSRVTTDHYIDGAALAQGPVANNVVPLPRKIATPV